MKKIGAALGCLLVTIVLFSSCLESEETELYPYVALYSFSIDDIETTYTYVNDEGNDTTTSVTIGGDYYPFTIDQTKGLIYNNDSLPVGTDITRVVVALSSDGTVYYRENGVDVLYSTTDSIDFTNPVVFTVVSTNGLYFRDYTATINVSNVDSDSLLWNSLSGNNFPGADITKQKSVIFNNRLYVFGLSKTSAQLCVTSTALSDGLSWTTLQPVETIATTADYSSITTFLGKLFAVTDSKQLYSSIDGLSWSLVNTNLSINQLLVTSSKNSLQPKMWGISGDSIVYTTDGENFLKSEVVPEDFPTENVTGLCYPLTTNANIDRYVLVGQDADADVDYSCVWSMLSTESSWTYYNPDNANNYMCPRLNNLSVIRYNNKLYAFGGAGVYQQEDVEAFSNLFVSLDNGITWKLSESEVMLPKVFKGRSANYSCVVDDDNRIWVLWGLDFDNVYKARLNKWGD